MPRNRIIYQSEGVFVGLKTPPTGVSYATTDIAEIYRVQSANYSFNLARRNVNQFGELAVIDRAVVDPPTVTLDVTYLCANVYNEQQLGFNVGSSVIPTNNFYTGIFAGTEDQTHYWVKTVPYGTDLHGLPPTGANAGTFGVIGFGNGYITSYTLDGAVGDFPKATVRIEASNIKFDNWTGGQTSADSPGVLFDGTLDPQTYVLPSGTSTTSANDKTTVLRPGQIVMNWDTYSSNIFGASIQDAKIQSFALTADIPRQPLRKLGQLFPFSREINFPINATLRVTADVGDMNTGTLSTLINDTGTATIEVKMFAPTGTTVNMGFQFRGAQLDSQDYSSAIGNNKSVTFTWLAPVGGINDLLRGIWMSGRL